MNRNFIKVIFICTMLFFSNSHAITVDRQDVKSFINNMVSQHGFDAEQLSTIFRHAEVSKSILKAIARPAESLPWYKYRPLFIQQERINLGVEFWKKNKSILQAATERYGVPAEIIIAIIGVETRYGRNIGRYKVIDSLTTLAFDYPERSSFFQSELEHYLLLTREQGMDPLTINGSYAGAMGIPQFISSSYRRFAVDFDKNGKIDIWNDTNDAIGSVANYFREHGWKPGKLIVVPAIVDGDNYLLALSKGLEPDIPVNNLTGYGITPGTALTQDEKIKLLDLETSKGYEYWLALHNFYVITRYNHSALYAMAVYELAQKIRKDYTDKVLRYD